MMAKAGTPGAIAAPPLVHRHLGQGVSYPPAYDGAGRLRISSGPKLVEESLESIARTSEGERPMLPSYGAASMVFEPLDAGRIQQIFKRAVAEHEPRVDELQVDASGDDKGVKMNVTYQLIGDITERTLVVPFYKVESST